MSVPNSATGEPSSMLSGAPEHVQFHDPNAGKTDEPASTPAAPPKEFFIGGKKFTSPEEMAQYLSNQESRISAMENLQRQQLQTTIQNTPKQVRPEDIVWEDPGAAFAMVEERTIAKIQQQKDLETARLKAWEDFYQKNPDLTHTKDLVDASRAQMAHEIANLPLDEAFAKIAKKTRDYVEQARRASGGTQERVLPSGPAVTTGASGGSAPIVSQPQQPTDFASQVKTWQRSRGKRK